MSEKRTATPTFLKEMFLSCYLFADVMLSRFLAPDKAKNIYDQYAITFGITETKWLDDLWNIISSDLFQKADNSSNFNTLSRLSILYPDSFSADEMYVISIKAKAMRTKEEIVPYSQNITLNATMSTIESKAHGGDADCLALLAFLEYNGFIFKKSINEALYKIRLGANWNHFFCTLMGAQYENESLHYHKIMRAILSEPSQTDSLNYLSIFLNISPNTEPSKLSLELEQAFHRGALQRYKLNSDIQKIMASAVLNAQGKCAILRNTTRNDQFHSEIPLEIDSSTSLTYDLSKFDIFSASRLDEYNRVTSSICISDIRASSAFKPLLVVCRDKSVFKLYHYAFSKCFGENPFAVIDFATIGNPSFMPSKDNTLISAMDKLRNRNAVLLLEHCETLSEEDSCSFAKYLSGPFRRNIKLNGSSQVSLDLSGILPIVLTSAMPCQKICDECDVIMASNLYSDEFGILIERMLDEKKNLFRLNSLTLEDAAKFLLYKYDYDTISLLLDKAIGRLRSASVDVAITIDEIQQIYAMYGCKKQIFNFWGDYRDEK